MVLLDSLKEIISSPKPSAQANNFIIQEYDVMVTCRSPKPFLRVRVLLLLPVATVIIIAVVLPYGVGSSAGRAHASHVRGQGFDPPHLHPPISRPRAEKPLFLLDFYKTGR